MNMELGQIIKLKANDNTICEVTTLAAKRSKYISDLIIDFDKEDVIDVPEADGPTLKEVVEYLEYYKDKEPVEIPQPIEEDERLRDLVDPWDVEFCERTGDVNRMMSIIIAADFMGINSLHELMCCQMACDWLDLGDCEQIKKKYGIEEDMTEEEAIELEKKEIAELKREKEENEKKEKEAQEEEFRKLLEEDDDEEEEEDDDCILDDKVEGEKIEVKENDK
jgi:hypothetical protein